MSKDKKTSKSATIAKANRAALVTPAPPVPAAPTATEPDPTFACAETNPWTPVLPTDPSTDDALLARLRTLDPSSNDFRLSLEQFVQSASNNTPNYLAATAYQQLSAAGRMSFHTVGCSGDPVVQAPQAAVADAMRSALTRPDSPAFLYHLGDIVYKSSSEDQDDAANTSAVANGLSDEDLLQLFYRNEFYGAYHGYNRPIFAIPGNHDGKYKIGTKHGQLKLGKSPAYHFLQNFCASDPIVYPANLDGAGDTTRPTMTQPYPFFVLETPVATIIGLYTNVCNGGALDLSPHTDAGAVQYHWLVARLKEVGEAWQKATASAKKALILATHYPPFSGTANFAERGDTQSGATPGPKPPEALASVLAAAFTEAGVWPDLVLSAHAHLYQRMTYAISHWDATKRERVIDRAIPCLIVGSGGHGPVEYLWRDCSGSNVSEVRPPFAAVFPRNAAPLPNGHTVTVVAYNDQDFGMVKITIDLKLRLLIGEFQAAYTPDPTLHTGRVRTDVFHVNLDTHTIS